MTITDAELAAIIGSPKTLTDQPAKQWREDRGQRRKTARAATVDGLHRFRIFARANLSFEENFSVGLVWFAPDGTEPILLRFNGPHGQHIAQGWPPDDPHYGYHVHRNSALDLNDGVLSERNAERTERYSSLEGALTYFAITCAIADFAKAFGIKATLPLFPEEP